MVHGFTGPKEKDLQAPRCYCSTLPIYRGKNLWEQAIGFSGDLGYHGLMESWVSLFQGDHVHMSNALSVVAGSDSYNMSWLVMLGLMNTLTEVTSTLCAVCIAWQREVGVTVENKTGEDALVDNGSLPSDSEGQMCLVIFFHLIPCRMSNPQSLPVQWFYVIMSPCVSWLTCARSVEWGAIRWIGMCER